MKARLTRRALAHLKRIHDHIEADSHRAATAQIERILEVVRLLEDFPAIGHAGEKPGALEFVVPRTPYIITYRLRGEQLEILGVYHGKQARRHWRPAKRPYFFPVGSAP